MDFKDFLSVITRRWLVLLPIAALVIGGHLFWVMCGRSPDYRATTMIVVNPPIGGSELPGARLVSPVNRVENFKESPVFSLATKFLTGERPFSAKVFDEPERQERIARFTEVFAAEADGEAGVARLQDEIELSTKVVAAKDERLITIEAISRDPERAAAFTWAVAEAARAFHIERCRETVERSVTDLQSQQKDFLKERELALKDQTDFAKRTGFTNFPRYQEMVQTIVLTIDGEISAARGQQREIERMIDERVSRSQQGADEIQAVAAELGESARLRTLQAELLKARIEHDVAASRLTEKHPSVADLKIKVDRLERLIDDEQEAIVADGLKKWSSATRDLVKQSAGLALKVEVLKERKASLSRELFRLTEVSQEYGRITERATVVTANLDRLKTHINDIEWAGLQAANQVQVHAPTDESKRINRQSLTVGALALSVLMAVFFALGVVYVLEYLDTRMKTEQDVRRYLGLPLLGLIPTQRKPLVTSEGSSAETAEIFNTAATLVRATARELGMKSFIVTSALAHEGKTTVAVNLAVSLARKGAKVVLVDGDLRGPRIHSLLGLANRTGLTTVLESRLDSARILEEVLSDSERGGARLGAVEALVETGIENLSVLPSGPVNDDPVALLESDRMPLLLKELSSAADFVIFDTPPVNLVGDALSLANHADGCIFVVGAGLAQHSDVAWAKHLLSNVQANLLGVFLNRSARQRTGGSYYRYYYQKGRRQGAQQTAKAKA